MVNEVCFDLSHSTRELECPTQRCLQCGDIIDAVIIRNRQLGQAAPALPSCATLPASAESSVAA